MAEKKKVKVYSVDQKGHYIFDHQFNEENAYLETRKLNDQALTDNYSNNINGDGEPANINLILKGNPFLYQENKETKGYIHSIEDFYIHYKKQDYAIGSLMRSNPLKIGKRKKIIKKSFKKWHKEVNVLLEKTYQEAQESLENVKLISLSQVSFWKFLLILVGIALPVLLILEIIPFITPIPDYAIVPAYGIAGLALTGFLTCLIHYGQLLKALHIEAKGMRVYKKNKVLLMQDFRKKFKKTKKYYFRLLGKKKIKKPPLEILKTTIGLTQIERLQEITNEMNKRTIANLNAKKKIKFTYGYPSFIAFFCSITSIGYALYLLVSELIKKWF